MEVIEGGKTGPDVPPEPREKSYRISEIHLSNPDFFPPNGINLGGNVEGLKIAADLFASRVQRFGKETFGLGGIDLILMDKDNKPLQVCAHITGDLHELFLVIPIGPGLDTIQKEPGG